MAKRHKNAIPRGRESLSIGALSRATHIPVETLRTWEQRYGSPMPVRKPSGHRVYPAGTVDHLRLVGRLLAHGHRPGEILRLQAAELDRLLALSDPSSPAKPASNAEPDVDAGWVSERLERLMRGSQELDRAVILRELQSSWIRLGPLRSLEDVIGPFLARVGRAWDEGTLEVRHEHFAFACVSDLLRSVRQPFDDRARGPRFVATTLPGERHEGGLMMASLLLAVQGYRVVYLGLDTPIEQVVAATKAAAAEAVIVSVSAATSPARASREITSLRKGLPPRLPLWVGGAGAPRQLPGVEHFASLTALDERLRTHVA
jgi:methanogenic corrinoid protein MtbC1